VAADPARFHESLLSLRWSAEPLRRERLQTSRLCPPAGAANRKRNLAPGSTVIISTQGRLQPRAIPVVFKAVIGV
jgi:hypothetical protein